MQRKEKGQILQIEEILEQPKEYHYKAQIEKVKEKNQKIRKENFHQNIQN